MGTPCHRIYGPFGPFAGSGHFALYSPIASMMLSTSPLAWWADVAFNACSAWSDSMVRTMVFPYERPPEPARKPAYDPGNTDERKPGEAPEVISPFTGMMAEVAD